MHDKLIPDDIYADIYYGKVWREFKSSRDGSKGFPWKPLFNAEHRLVQSI